MIERLGAPDPGMELCYECEGGRVCIMCRGARFIDEQPCISCGHQGWCIVCRGAGQLTLGTYRDRIDRGLIKP